MLITRINPCSAVANHLRADVRVAKQHSSSQTAVSRNAGILHQDRLVINKIRKVLLRYIAKSLVHLRRVDTEQPDTNRTIKIEDRDHVAAVNLNHFSKQRRALDGCGRRTQKSAGK